MKRPGKLLFAFAVPASVALLQPLQAQMPPQPPAASADATDAQQQKAAPEAHRQNQPAEAPAPWPSTRDWPSKTAPSELKAKNSETFVEPMEGPSSAMEICEEAGDPNSECADQPPPQRKPRPRERPRPR